MCGDVRSDRWRRGGRACPCVQTDRPGRAETLAALKTIHAARPDGAPIYVILDNQAANKGTDIRRWAKKNEVELCFTPTYASRANPIEARFAPLRQFTIADSNHPNHTVRTRALHAYLGWRNANARHTATSRPRSGDHLKITAAPGSRG
ncbi:transposase [Streptomyces sp. NPDC003247]|uniref:transposase n=1 Tax=Streptomyces sp. NPDC003247 TaxID=3364677 RepID=UPI0036B0F7DA